jgi:SAM-dependent methyltransferase
VIAGDAERLPLADASVDHAVVLNAFHHVPDEHAALAELYRVLRPGGRLFLSEPGRGHKDAATSIDAAGSYGVQEEEVIAEDLLADCRRAGFSRAVLKPLSYSVPWFEIDHERWRRWRQFAATRRPLRALGRIRRALADAVGVGKQGDGFEDTLGMELVRITEGAIQHHPIVVAEK